MGVDVLQLPLTESGNQYAVVFLDYLTKWAEAFPVANLECSNNCPTTCGRDFLPSWSTPGIALRSRCKFLIGDSPGSLQVVEHEESEHLWLPPTNRWSSRTFQLYTLTHDCQMCTEEWE